jgi:hypothetical protein
MPLPEYATWDCTRCPAIRSAPCGKPVCPGYLIDSRDFKTARVEQEKAAADAVVAARNLAEAQRATSFWATGVGL